MYKWLIIPAAASVALVAALPPAEAQPRRNRGQPAYSGPEPRAAGFPRDRFGSQNRQSFIGWNTPNADGNFGGPGGGGGGGNSP